MAQDFKNEKIWLLGASTGIGHELAKALIDKGAFVTITARNKAALEELKTLAPDRVTILAFDLSLEAERTKVLKQLEGQTFDRLIYNAGLTQRAYAEDTRLDQVRNLMEVNFFGAVHIGTEALKTGLLKPSGHLVLVSSVLGYLSTPLRSSYAASKHALHGYFNSIRAEWKGRGLKVTLLCPGYVATGIDNRAVRGEGEEARKTKIPEKPKGLATETFVRRALPQLAAFKPEIYVGGPEISGIYLQRFLPRVVYRIADRFAPEAPAP